MGKTILNLLSQSFRSVSSNFPQLLIMGLIFKSLNQSLNSHVPLSRIKCEQQGGDRLHERWVALVFYVSLCFLHQVLSIMHGLSKAMQEINVKWLNVANEMVAVRKLLVEMDPPKDYVRQ